MQRNTKCELAFDRPLRGIYQMYINQPGLGYETRKQKNKEENERETKAE